MPSLTTAPPCLSLAIKDSLKADAGLLLWCFLFFDREGFWLLDEGRLLNVGGFGRERNF
jgi:hypothetical protein